MTVKKAEHQRTDAFELWCWGRLLRVPWTARRSNQSILKEISPGCSLEGMMLNLKLQYFGHLMRRVESLEKETGKIESINEMKWSEVAQLCLTLRNTMGCSLPGSSAHWIFQARVVEWAAISLLQGILPTQGSNPGPPHCRQMLYHLSHQRSHVPIHNH